MGREPNRPGPVALFREVEQGQKGCKKSEKKEAGMQIGETIGLWDGSQTLECEVIVVFFDGTLMVRTPTGSVWEVREPAPLVSGNYVGPYYQVAGNNA